MVDRKPAGTPAGWASPDNGDRAVPARPPYRPGGHAGPPPRPPAVPGGSPAPGQPGGYGYRQPPGSGPAWPRPGAPWPQNPWPVRPTYREPHPVRSRPVWAGIGATVVWFGMAAAVSWSMLAYLWGAVLAAMLALGAAVLLARIGDRGVAAGVAGTTGVGLGIPGIIVLANAIAGHWLLW